MPLFPPLRSFLSLRTETCPCLVLSSPLPLSLEQPLEYSRLSVNVCGMKKCVNERCLSVVTPLSRVPFALRTVSFLEDELGLCLARWARSLLIAS